MTVIRPVAAGRVSVGGATTEAEWVDDGGRLARVPGPSHPPGISPYRNPGGGTGLPADPAPPAPAPIAPSAPRGDAPSTAATSTDPAGAPPEVTAAAGALTPRAVPSVRQVVARRFGVPPGRVRRRCVARPAVRCAFTVRRRGTLLRGVAVRRAPTARVRVVLSRCCADPVTPSRGPGVRGASRRRPRRPAPSASRSPVRRWPWSRATADPHRRVVPRCASRHPSTDRSP